MILLVDSRGPDQTVPMRTLYMSEDMFSHGVSHLSVKQGIWYLWEFLILPLYQLLTNVLQIIHYHTIS